MGNPWDPPGFPRKGDRSNKPLYESIGRTLVAWEELESSLAHLYAAFIEKDRYDRSAHHEYGEKANFVGRFGNLRRAFEHYAVKYPSQDREGEFVMIAKEIEGWSARRNDVAHGLVRPIQVIRDRDVTLLSIAGEIEWCLIPPEFKEAKYVDRDTPAHILSSREIGSFGAHFWPLIHRVNALAEKVELPHHASNRKLVERRALQWRLGNPHT